MREALRRRLAGGWHGFLHQPVTLVDLIALVVYVAALSLFALFITWVVTPEPVEVWGTAPRPYVWRSTDPDPDLEREIWYPGQTFYVFRERCTRRSTTVTINRELRPGSAHLATRPLPVLTRHFNPGCESDAFPSVLPTDLEPGLWHLHTWYVYFKNPLYPSQTLGLPDVSFTGGEARRR